MNIEQEFYEVFNIPKNVRKYRQYNYGQVEFGLSELEKSKEAGIECKWIKDTPTEENYCVYWTELYYPSITDRILLELIVANNENAPAVGDTLEELRDQVLYWCIQYKSKIYKEVRKIMGVEE